MKMMGIDEFFIRPPLIKVNGYSDSYSIAAQNTKLQTPRVEPDYILYHIEIIELIL